MCNLLQLCQPLPVQLLHCCVHNEWTLKNMAEVGQTTVDRSMSIETNSLCITILVKPE